MCPLCVLFILSCIHQHPHTPGAETGAVMGTERDGSDCEHQGNSKELIYTNFKSRLQSVWAQHHAFDDANG